jgi:vacuolar-type H+-ATPase subunit H
VADIPALVTILVAFISAGAAVLAGVISSKRQAAATITSAREQANATVAAAQGQAKATLASAESQANALIENAERQSGATIKTTQEDRFAAWQMYKREVYADFLTAAQGAVVEADSDEAQNAFRAQANRIRVTASRDLRELLIPHLADPAAVTMEPLLSELLEQIGTDIREGHPAD